MVLLFHDGMRAGERPSTDMVSWFMEPDQPASVAPARRPSRALLAEERDKSRRVAIVSSLFLVLLGAALLVGGHAVIDPLLQSAAAAREARAVGDVVYAMPDGIFCRHMSFDNVTAEVIESTMQRCTDDMAKQRARATSGFAWHNR